ncbi:centrosomal protein of 83 kDa-like [Antennarius striatus]|uniref:centrosomal protein of 83 kDa-like n=1 Tax=Antennarius striatus TaxID=241820 RepID=UPI0035B47F53
MTPQQLELVRGQAEQEMEAKCMERISRMEKEVKQYKGGYDEVLQKCASLVSQMECQRDEHAHILKEMNVLHETEISRLVNERKELVACCHHLDSLRVAKDKEALQKEKVELSIRMSNMEAQDALKSVKTENQWLRQQLERMRTECEHRESLEKLSSSKHMYKTEKEVSALNNQIEKLKQTHNLEIAKMKMELKSSKGELEREKKALKKQRDDLLEEIKKMQVAVKQYKAALFEKEQEMVKKVQSTREEELCRFAALHEEKSKLVDRLASLERTKALKDAEDISEKMEWEGRLHRALLGKESAQRELQSLRSKLQEFEETAKQQAELSDLQQQNLELRIQLERCTESKSDCRETLSQVHEELRRVRAEEEQLNDRYNKLQQKYFILKDKLKRAEEAQKTRKSLTESTERNLQNQIEQLEAKNEELQEQQHHKQLSLLGQRMKDLERTQQLQLDGL